MKQLFCIILLVSLIFFGKWYFRLDFTLINKNLSAYSHIIDLIVAIGTLIAAIAAAWFGLVGNFETRLLLKKNEQELDKEAYLFLLSIPTSSGQKKIALINDFEEKIFNKLLSRKKIKKYSSYIILSKKFDDLYNYKDYKKYFYQIKKEILRLEKNIIGRNNYSEKLQNFFAEESRAFLTKNIILIEPHNEMISPLLVYTKTTPEINNTDHSEDYKNVRKLIRSSNSIDSIYSSFLENNYTIIFPGNWPDYELIYIKNCWLDIFCKIKIKYRNKLITLYYNKPKLLND